MKSLLAALAAAVLLSLSGPVGQARASDDLAGLAAKIQQRYQKIDCLRAGYQRQSLFVTTGDMAARKVEGSGVLSWARPIYLRLDQATPRKEVIVAGSEGVWWVRPERKRAELYPLNQFTAGLGPLLDALGGLSRLDSAFNLLAPEPEESPDGFEGPVLALEPKTARADLKRLVVWFSPDDLVLAGFKIISLIGDVTEYRLHSVEVNPDLPSDTFTYAPPEGFRVIRRAGQN